MVRCRGREKKHYDIDVGINFLQLSTGGRLAVLEIYQRGFGFGARKMRGRIYRLLGN
jgi:hypothetical protein